LKLLQGAGLKDVKVVPVPDPEKSPVDFAWRSEGVIGGLRERKVPTDMTLEKMSEIIEGGYKKQCSGTYDSNVSKTESMPGVNLRTLDVSCDMSGHSARVALLVYLTDTHLFSMFMNEAEDGSKEKATSARNKIANAIRKLAKSQAGKAGASAPASEEPPPASVMMRRPDPSAIPSAPEPVPPAAPAAAPAPAATPAPAK
jgi:hypothetical protein